MSIEKDSIFNEKHIRLEAIQTDEDPNIDEGALKAGLIEERDFTLPGRAVPLVKTQQVKRTWMGTYPRPLSCRGSASQRVIGVATAG